MNWRLALLVCTVGLLLSCAAPGAGSPGGGEGAPTAAGPKTLRIAIGREAKPGLVLFDQQGGTGSELHALAFHSGLTYHDSEGEAQPLLAQRIPTLTAGDWRLLPTGGMEVTWKLRTDVKWQDGRPFTSDDLMLGMRIVQDPELEASPPTWLRFVSEFAAPDPHTFVLTWSEPYFLADRIKPTEVPAVASHIVGQLYADGVQSGNKQNFLNSPYWSVDWIGLGPFRVTNRVVGSHIDAAAFDDYFLGRPKIDRLNIRFIPEANAMILAVLSGDVDVVPAGSFSTAHVHTLKEQWEPNGAGAATLYPSGMASNNFQFGDPEAPWAKDLRVRKAIVHMYDRQAYVDALEYGLTTVADVLVGPTDSVYKLIEQRGGIPHYPHDLNAAARLMGEAGWTRGGDGVYRNAAGNTFEIEVITKHVTDESFRRTQTSAAMLKAAGLNATAWSYPNAIAGVEDRKIRSTFRGLFASINVVDEPRAGQGFLTSGIRVDNDGVSLGSNTYRYSNPQFDQIFDRYITTLEPGPRQTLRADVLRIIAEDLPVVPLYYSFIVLSQTIRSNVKGIGFIHPNQSSSGWNIHTWSME